MLTFDVDESSDCDERSETDLSQRIMPAVTVKHVCCNVSE